MPALRFLPQAEAELFHEARYDSEARSGAGVGFPFSIIYRASDSAVLVMAIAGHLRRPNY